MNPIRAEYLFQASAYRKYLWRVNAIGMTAEGARGVEYLSEKVAADNAIAQLERVPRPVGFDAPLRMMTGRTPMPVPFYTLRNARIRVMDAKRSVAYAETRWDFPGLGLEDAKYRLREARARHAYAAKDFGKPVPLPGRLIDRLEQQATADLITASRVVSDLLAPFRRAA